MLGLVAFPLVVVGLASRAPVVPTPPGALASIGEPRAAPPLRDLPVLPRAAGFADRTRPADRTTLRRAVFARIDALLGDRRSSQLRGYLRAPARLGPATGPAGLGPAPYPYRYAGVDRLLDAVPVRGHGGQAGALGQLGALLVLAAAQERPAADEAFRNAGQVAFAVLDRARAAGACDPQLNLAFLLTAAKSTDSGNVQRELGKADDACGRDPTALWLHGQWLSVQGDDYRATQALRTFASLQRRFPGSAAGWSGKGDVLLRLAYRAQSARQPFTTQSRFARALPLYRRARQLDPAAELGAGEARALAGLRRYGQAWRVQARAARATGRPAALQARLLEYHERAGRFADAAREARRLAAAARFPDGTALMFAVPPDVHDEEDVNEPLSLGAGRLRPVVLDVAPSVNGFSGGDAGSGAAVEDLSFIPRFRDAPGLTGVRRWCPEWAARRDLVLAGRAAAALSGMPRAFRPVHPDADCSDLNVRTLRAVASAEAGRRKDAIAALGGRARPGAALYELRQNLWRFASSTREGSARRGATRWDEARRLTARWMKAAPSDARAFDQAGEVAFLSGRRVTAARLFATSARLTRERAVGWSVAEARALTKQGAALKLADRRAEALDALEAAADVAARALASGRHEQAQTSSAEPLLDAVNLADERITEARDALYHAHAQAADVLLRGHRFADAVAHYEAARRHATDADAGEDARSEVLDNNQALAEIYRGNPKAAVALARDAVSHDPLNPLFLQTEGFALARLQRPVPAAWRYGRAVSSDPSLFPAWNDLGVVLARSGREEAAVAAFRRAVGARRNYATGWFNLGVVLERRGLRHALAAQGALGRAFALDPELADVKRELITDEGLYFTNLDLSKPLPPEWDFASSQGQLPLPAAGLTLLLLLGLQAARAAGARGLIGGAPRWLDAARELLSRVPGALTSFAPSAIAIAATLGVFLWPAINGDDDSLAGLALLALGLIALVTLVMRARVLVARRLGVKLSQRGWRPAILVALVAAPIGIPWAPLPIAEPDRPEPRVHLVGPVVSAGVGLVLLILSAWLQVPLTRSLGIAAIIMAASMLTPVKPLDGAQMQGAAGPLTAGLALGGTALLVALGLL